MANPNPQTTWNDSLAPTMRTAAHHYLRTLAKMSTDATSLSPTERMLRLDMQVGGDKNARRFSLLIWPTILISAVPILGFALSGNLIAMTATFAIGVVLLVLGWLRTEALSTSVPLSLIPRSLPLVAKTRTEKLYVEAALQLLPSENGDTIPDDIRRERMGQLSALFASGNQLETIGEEIRAGLSGQEPGRLRGERANLYERLARTADRETQTALEKSLALCEERIARTEKLLILRGRVEAQCEVVYQAFGAVQGALASMRLSPSLATSATSDQTAEIAITIGRQTAAVEQAVQEVLALKAGN